jgi:hypothetical protein
MPCAGTPCHLFTGQGGRAASRLAATQVLGRVWNCAAGEQSPPAGFAGSTRAPGHHTCLFRVFVLFLPAWPSYDSNESSSYDSNASSWEYVRFSLDRGSVCLSSSVRGSVCLAPSGPGETMSGPHCKRQELILERGFGDASAAACKPLSTL